MTVKDPPFMDGLLDKSVSLFAGTKYHLASSYYHAKFDYLFVDEASQMSLTDIVADTLCVFIPPRCPFLT